MSTSYSKFPEKLLLFRKVANLNFNHEPGPAIFLPEITKKFGKQLGCT